MLGLARSVRRFERPSLLSLRAAHARSFNALAEFFNSEPLGSQRSGTLTVGSKQDVAADFIMHQEIQRGRFGVVKKAELRATGQMFAIKTITKNQIPDKSLLQNEIDITRELDDFHCLRCHDTYEDSRYLHVVMDLCEGGELFERILAAETGFSEADSAELFEQIMKGVQYMHSRDIVHRDIKPENLMFLSDTDDANLLHIDFGMAKRIPPGERSKDQVGSIMYCAPETLRNRGALGHDRSCDVWSCGVVLYIMLVGYPPFGGSTDRETMDEVLNRALLFDEPEWAHISASAKDLIVRMLDRDPDKRPSTAECLRDDWTTKHAKSRTEPLPKAVLASMRRFHDHSKLKQHVLNVMVDALRPADFAELEEHFARLDVDSTGVVQVADLRETLDAKCGVDIEALDTNKDGQIDIKEFVASGMRRSLYLQEENMYAAFTKLDRDGNGRLSRDEIARVVGEGPELDDAMASVDLDGNGEVDFEEFLIMMRRY